MIVIPAFHEGDIGEGILSHGPCHLANFTPMMFGDQYSARNVLLSSHRNRCPMPDGEGQLAKSFQLVKDYSAAVHTSGAVLSYIRSKTQKHRADIHPDELSPLSSGQKKADAAEHPEGIPPRRLTY
ncbi:MAG: hypothetical protein NTZ32_20285 [Planctomycetales bacterium]|nr:hypothetical protein [Planctomycetales bacterium]